MIWVAWIVLLALIAKLALLLRETRWDRMNAEAVGRVRRTALPARADGELGDVPEPVRRYLRQAIPSGIPPVSMVRVLSRGQFLVRPPSGWGPFRATQVFSVRPPAFVWDARIRFMPGMTVRVRDAFAEGKGSTHAALFGAFPFLAADGAGALAIAALQRYLAETVWFPQALLPANGVRWSAIDGSSARATLAAVGVEAGLEFRFGDDGMVREVFAAERGRSVGKVLIPTPWRGRHEAYREMAGSVIPTRAEVEWELPEGPRPYWRGEIDDVQHDPAG
jgi:uncharacterized protein DUF6920